MSTEQHGEYTPIPVHVTGSDIPLTSAPAAPPKRKRTTFQTVKLTSANALGALPILPEASNRIHALINPHTPGTVADASSSMGWISKNKSDANSGQGHFIKAAGQGPYITYATDALYAASDAASTTDLWLAITATYEE